MAGPISQQPQHTHVLEMEMLWLHVLVCLFKWVFYPGLCWLFAFSCPDHTCLICNCRILSLCSSILQAFMVLDAWLLKVVYIQPFLLVLSFGNSFVCKQVSWWCISAREWFSFSDNLYTLFSFCHQDPVVKVVSLETVKVNGSWNDMLLVQKILLLVMLFQDRWQWKLEKAVV